MSDFAEVARVGSTVEAQLIAGMLDAHGIRAIVSADDAGGLEPQLQAAGVRVLVASADADEARSLIEEPGE